MISHERLKALMHYDPETGVFVHLKSRGGIRAGRIAGHPGRDGHIRIKCDNELHLASRLAWFYMTGAWPIAELDHKNVNPSDNRWENLRPATRSQNNVNRRRHCNNRSGFKGVSWCKKRGLWRATIYLGSKHIHLGYFSDKEAAFATYCAMVQQHHGEFGRVA